MNATSCIVLVALSFPLPGSIEKGSSPGAENHKVNSKESAKYIELGQMLSYHGDLSDAAAAFERAISVDPNNLDGHLFLAGVYEKLLERQGAIKEYQKVLNINPKHKEVYVPLANLLIAEGDYGGAIKVLKEGRSLLRDSSEVEQTLAYALLSKGEFGEAEALFRSLISTNPKVSNVQPRMGLAMVLFKKGNSQAALKELNSVLESEPENPAVHALKGDIYNSIDQTGAAIEEYEKAIEQDPSDSQAYESLGNLYLHVKDFVESKRIFLQAVKKCAQDKEILYGLALSLEGLSEIQSAIQTYEAVLKLENDGEKIDLVKQHLHQLRQGSLN